MLRAGLHPDEAESLRRAKRPLIMQGRGFVREDVSAHAIDDGEPYVEHRPDISQVLVPGGSQIADEEAFSLLLDDDDTLLTATSRQGFNAHSAACAGG